MFLFDAPARGGAQLDALRYGLQIDGYSVGRGVDGRWRLNHPTPARANLAAATGNPAFLRINEWMARPAAGDDWFELYNPTAQPADLGRMFLTDDLNDRTRSEVPPLSFIGPGGFQVFQADSTPDKGADHVTFRLSAEGESLGLFTKDGGRIDAVSFGPQEEAVSAGRLPDGAGGVQRFPGRPTPGASNDPEVPADRDGDGLPDLWEELHGLSPADPNDAAGDLDNDGLSNRQEYLSGTRPNDRFSRLQLEVLPHPAGVRFLFQGMKGHTYSVLSRVSLDVGAWEPDREFGPAICDCALFWDEPLPEAGAPSRYFLLVTPAVP